MAVELGEPEEPGVETTATRTSRRHLSTNSGGPEDDAPRQYGRVRSQIPKVEQDGSDLLRCAAWDEVEEPILLYVMMEKVKVKCVEPDPEDGTQTFRTLLEDG